jgi:spore germination protein
MSKLKILLIIFISFIGLTGCEQPKVIDDILLIQAIGYDHYKENYILGTIATPIYAHTGGSGQVQAKTDAFSVITHKGHALDTLLEARSEHPLQLGKLMVVLYEDNLARAGIFPYIDILNRSPDVGRVINLAVVDGKAEDMLKGKYRSAPLVSIYLSDLLEHNTNEDFPKNNLHEFLYSYYGEGMDPFLPLVKKKGNHVGIEGIALFKNDKYVGSLPYSYSFVFKSMFQSFNGGSYSVPWDDDHYISIMNIDTNVHYEVKFNRNGIPEVTIHVKEKGFLRESSAIMKPDTKLKTIQRILKRDLEKSGMKVIRKLQTLKVDPLRIGDHVRSYDRNWNQKKWEDEYPDIRIKVNFDVNLAQTGIVE